MKFTLKDYQEDAVDDVLNTLERARTAWERDGEESSVALTAPTGAGKTVMAAAVIEALFYGSEKFDVDPDDGAVVLWFSDDPNLNDQTRMRLMDASEKFTSSDLVTIEPPFAKAKLDPGRVYFLNTQKLSKTSKLTRGHVEDGSQPALPGTPDLQGYTIWETIANTVADEDLTLYLVLDEAHRGFNTKTSSDKTTIVRRLVQGHAGYPPIPIVWGISATIERFRTAMNEANESGQRRDFPAVMVDPNRVQESGLVKDVVSLDIPNEAGNFDTTLVKLAAQKLASSTERWAAYSKDQGLTETVVPLLVLQTPNTPDPDEIGRALDTIAEVMPELHGGNVAHVFGDHSRQHFGRWDVGWIEPQRVQETPDVRILVAKDAISTGWDCPRAEVMVSFRPAKDTTHITQLLGRMVRSPLARRVPGDEALNAVECILPFFDRTTAAKVVRYLTGQLEEMPGNAAAKKILLDGRELRPNPAIPDSVWSAWDKLPTQTLPKRGARPIKRLVALAQALAMDGVRPGALSDTEREMHLILDTYATRYGSLLDEQIDEVWRVDIQEISGTSTSDKLTYREFSMRADDRAIRSAFEDAKKAFGADIAQSYVNHLAGEADEDDDGLRGAYVRASALAMIKEVREKVDQEATELVDGWFATHRVAIKSLSDVRQQDYEDIRAMTTDPQRGELGQPRSRMEDYKVLEGDDQVAFAPLVGSHLMSDEDGMFPMSSLNKWEQKVVTAELRQPGAMGWYRNPSRPAVDSLGVAYRDGQGNWRTMHPDFVFFHEVGGEVRASIVDPHGTHLDDAVAKLKALAEFTQKFGGEFHRIEALAQVGTTMKVLDMTKPAVREAVLHENKSAVEFYESDLAVEYSA
ncbi:type III restriction endonuclease subunit R [Mycolicibacter virginiensis]|uniref:Type III restriction endonuclease subunit R n=1 Tax=Mycolicibacter virginiensis TaxID=1795032 RepID=A0A9X7NZP0_9MYCO|nr:DEAD/DEAH box helicase family protein [Mycolicibacter virginiensis]PQM53302.1 type III restriction endonuclease subunit R [Mycolicibacter virginiensis]